MVQGWWNHWKTIDANGALEKKTLPSHRYEKMTIVEVYCNQYVCIFGKSGTKFWQKVDWICGEFDVPQQQQLFAFVK